MHVVVLAVGSHLFGIEARTGLFRGPVACARHRLVEEPATQPERVTGNTGVLRGSRFRTR
ncbi:hypothetical protein DQ353_01445 [Arthrobacter sp. AQ5-05]|nr:hypothetical protein DQ353_01445 [Arthrobacter sp. AQ5-05]